VANKPAEGIEGLFLIVVLIHNVMVVLLLDIFHKATSQFFFQYNGYGADL
jgi:hypothetical protein